MVDYIQTIAIRAPAAEDIFIGNIPDDTVVLVCIGEEWVATTVAKLQRSLTTTQIIEDPSRVYVTAEMRDWILSQMEAALEDDDLSGGNSTSTWPGSAGQSVSGGSSTATWGNLRVIDGGNSTSTY